MDTQVGEAEFHHLIPTSLPATLLHHIHFPPPPAVVFLPWHPALAYHIHDLLQLNDITAGVPPGSPDPLVHPQTLSRVSSSPISSSFTLILLVGSDGVDSVLTLMLRWRKLTCASTE
ncbi:hypothetical protein MLD38_016453 [Melastoma candidum]|uniref:Uncharacterized protein n=1 Tax=Melastoma candidum TaxID=119954 RepID=A0ACB9QLS8_9MYRT|nr:hypothetical protein MLD38_016453 [Melastoma candidum]